MTDSVGRLHVYIALMLIAIIPLLEPTIIQNDSISPHGLDLMKINCHCPISVLTVLNCHYFQKQQSSDNLCYHTHKDRQPDGLLDFTSSAQTQCNGKQSCVWLFQWRQFDPMFSSDTYRGNMFIDILYSCVGK